MLFRSLLFRPASLWYFVIAVQADEATHTDFLCLKKLCESHSYIQLGEQVVSQIPIKIILPIMWPVLTECLPHAQLCGKLLQTLPDLLIMTTL